MLSNFEDWENIIHFGNIFASIGKKTYFFALGTIPVTGVGFIARKITVMYVKRYTPDMFICNGYISLSTRLT